MQEVFERLLARFGPQHWWPGDTRFEIVVGAVLVQNTSWSNAELAIGRLATINALTPHGLARLSLDALGATIYSSGFYNQKAVRLKEVAQLLLSRWGGSLENMDGCDTEQLRSIWLSVKGIGEETADAICLYAFDRPLFVIDAYTRRVLHRHGIAHGSQSYRRLQALMHRIVAPDVGRYQELHALLTRVGQEYCGVTARCDGCPLNDIRHASELE